MVALVACTPLALVAIQPVTSVGWRRPNVVALGHLVLLSRTKWFRPGTCPGLKRVLANWEMVRHVLRMVTVELRHACALASQVGLVTTVP